MTEFSIRKSPAKFSIPKITYRVWKVWRRNADVFVKTIGVNFLPSLLEPIFYLLAFGFGLGGFIPEINGQPYLNFIAPALVAISLMNGSFFECTYGSFVRMYYQKTFDAIVATPVSVEEVVAGELLWGATRGNNKRYNRACCGCCFRIVRFSTVNYKSTSCSDTCNWLFCRFNVLRNCHVLYCGCAKH